MAENKVPVIDNTPVDSGNVLTTVEHETVALLSAEFSTMSRNIKAGLCTKSEMNSKVSAVFQSEAVTLNVKKALASKFFRLIPSVTVWAFENLTGRPLFILTQVEDLTLENRKALARNVNLTWYIVHHMLTVNTNIRTSRKSCFIFELNTIVFTEDFAYELVKVYKQAKLEESLIASKFRQIFNMDDLLPDSWVIKMVESGAGSSND